MLIKKVAIVLTLISLMMPANGWTAPFNPDVLNSVVSLLPEWPHVKAGLDAKMGGPKDPEGSAVAIFPGGYLATNSHVLGAAKAARIRLNDGRILPAQILAKDNATDLALIKVDIDLPVLERSSEVQLGNSVCAVGNQFGLGLSVTCGVISATGRTGMGFNPIEDFIQTDAVINPGGSGGALVDHQGRLAGLVSAIFTKNGDSNIGVNFATSSLLLYRIMEDLRDHGKVIRVKSGLRVRRLADLQRQYYSGAEVIKTLDKSPAFKAGLKSKDIVTRIGLRSIRKPTDVTSAFQFIQIGEHIRIEFIRDNQQMETTVQF